MTQRTNRTEKLDLRLSRAAKQTLQAAAAAERKSVSEFVLDLRSAKLRSGSPIDVSSRSMARSGPSSPHSTRRRAVTRALSDCFASLRFDPNGEP